MSADILRKAAAFMRERAEAAEVSAAPRWDEMGNVERSDWYTPSAFSSRHVASVADSEFISAWGPSVARAIAAWIEFEADTCVIAGENRQTTHALAVARAYLGADS